MIRYIAHFLPLLLLVSLSTAANDWNRTQCGKGNIVTQWGEQVNPQNVLPEYPRPQLVRPNNTWKSLNGLWEFEPAESLSDSVPFGRVLTKNILVPFPVESCLSGIGANYQYLWYRLIFDKPANFTNAITLLNFGAVDWQCSVWVNTKWVGNHTGGYDPFSFNITPFIQETYNELIVFVYDPSENGPQPSGKQFISAIDNPESIRCTPASGIWQTVWLENVPATYISNLRILADTRAVTITTFTTPDNTGPLHGFTNSGADLPGMPITLSNNSHWKCYQMCQNNPECKAWSFGIPLCGNETQPRCWLKGTLGVNEENYCRISGSRLQPIPIKYAVYDGLDIVAIVFGLSGVVKTISIPNPKIWNLTDPFLYTIDVSISSETIRSYFGMRSVSMTSYLHPEVPDPGPQIGYDCFYGDMPGSPIFLTSADHNLCRDECEKTQGCVAWAYRIPNCAGYSRPTCYLKSSIFAFTPNPCVISGRLAIPAFSTMEPQLNRKNMFYAGWLDTSYWPDGIYTAPTDEALEFDVKAVKTFGFNSVRLHQKVNSERWYWYSDSLGVAVMQDMVQKMDGTSATIEPFIVDLYRMIDNKYNHPSIVQWQIFNSYECILAFNVSQVAQIANDLDSSRLIDFNPGGPFNYRGYGDVNSIFSFPNPSRPPPSITQYGNILFGGLGIFIPGKQWVPNSCWSHWDMNTPDKAVNFYIHMITGIADFGVSECVYIQITDVEIECDGFLNYDRTNKFNDTLTQTIFNATQALIKNATQPDNCSDGTCGKSLNNILFFLVPIPVLLLLALGITLRYCFKRKQRNNTEPQMNTPLLSSSYNNILYTENLKILNDVSQQTYLLNPITQTSSTIVESEGIEGERQIRDERGEEEQGVEGEETREGLEQQLLSHHINTDPSTYNNMDFDNIESDEKVLQFSQTFE